MGGAKGGDRKSTIMPKNDHIDASVVKTEEVYVEYDEENERFHDIDSYNDCDDSNQPTAGEPDGFSDCNFELGTQPSDEKIDAKQYLMEMLYPEEEEIIISRKIARNSNVSRRPDCPVCGAKANGIHYGIYTCEACKNFFKRTMTIKKPYLCFDVGSCKVNTQLDNLGRKGTRCQACRFKACLDAGMMYSGNVGRGPRKRQPKADLDDFSYAAGNIKRDVESNLLAPLPNTISITRISETDSGDNHYNRNGSPPAKKAKIPNRKAKNGDYDLKMSNSLTMHKDKKIHSEDQISYEVGEEDDFSEGYKSSIELLEQVYKADLASEQKKREEVETVLESRNETIKILESQVSMLKHHSKSSQQLVEKQRKEIDRLKSDLLAYKALLLEMKQQQPNCNGRSEEDNLAQEYNGDNDSNLEDDINMEDMLEAHMDE